jgi:Photosynthesis affected mutant 68
MSSESERNRLPFEPGKTRKKSAQKDSAPKDSAPKDSSQKDSNQKDSNQKEQSSSKSSESPKAATASDRVTKQKKTAKNTPSRSQRLKAIPDTVNKRMMTRMGIFSITPTLLGVLSLIGSYFVVSHDLFPLPNFAVLIASISCFGLGFLGITYGALSASWEEDKAGSLLGIAEFQTNLGRMIAAWRESRNS